MSYAVSDHVAVSLMRELSDSELQVVGKLLDRVENMILARIPEALVLAEKDEVFSANLITVEADAVARVLRAPDNGVYRRETEGNYSYDINMSVASGILEVRAKEWELLGVRDEYKVLAPKTDAYVETRGAGTVPEAFRFQSVFPAENSLSERVWGRL